MRKFLRMNEVIELTWDDKFARLLEELDAIFHGQGSTNNRQCAARATLLLLKEGAILTGTDILRRVREEDDASPLGLRMGYDLEYWTNHIRDAVNALESDNPYKALVADFNR